VSTLPATIPGLVRFCTPLCFRDEETPWVAIGCGPIEGGDPTLLLVTATPRSAFGLAITAGAEDFEVDLADPTGFCHALLWLAEKYGVDPSFGLVWKDDGCVSWQVRGRTQVSPWIIAQSTDTCEALRLAVLAVAGVQG
jgi:hypothetical protein